jgi:DNA polymerase IV
VRLTGVTVSGFEPPVPAPQLELFAAAGPGGQVEEAGAARRRALNAALDALADRFGDGAVRPASAAPQRTIRWQGKPRPG